MKNHLNLIQCHYTLYKSFVTLFTVISFCSLSGAAVNSCRSLFNSGSPGAAVEMEMPPILKMLTTSDGTVGGLFHSTNINLPEFYLSWVKKAYPFKEPSELEWDLVEPSIQMELLRTLSQSLDPQRFLTDRSVPNVKIKPILRLSFEKTTQFLGKTYEKGEHDVDVSEFLSRVEFAGPDAMTQFSEVELHLRKSNFDAGVLIESAWNLQKGLGDKKRPLHEHILARIPVESLKWRQIDTSLLLTEYFRRFNLLAEFITIGQHEGIYINKTKKKEIEWKGLFNFKIHNREWTNFGPMSSNFLSTILRYFMSGANHKLGSMLKMGWVGFRGSDYYDNPGLYGFEWRSPTGRDNPELIKKIATQVQYGMEHEQYGISIQDLRVWYMLKNVDINNFKHLNKLEESWWYNQSYETLKKNMPEYIKEVLGNRAMGFLKIAWLKYNADGNQAVKMLLYDWTNDPLFKFAPQEVKETLIREQQKALTNYFIKGVHLKAVIKEFVWSSGLLENVAQTFKLEVKDFDNLFEP